jgi:hypothetical protein
LYSGLHGNLDNIAVSVRNRYAGIGTKHLIEEYFKGFCAALDFIYQTDEIDFYENSSFLMKQRMLLDAVALCQWWCLSGGSTVSQISLYRCNYK